MFLYRSIILLTFAAAPTAALADQVHVLDSQNGELHATDQVVSDAALDALMGGKLDSFDRPTYVVRDLQTGALTPIFVSPKAYELVQDGDGVLSPPVLVDGAQPEVIDLDDLPTSTPIELFPEGPRAGQPEDGTWKAEVISVDVVGCPQNVVAATMQGPNEKTMQITFSDPMHPSDLSPGFAQLSWEKISGSTWRSEIVKMPSQQGVSAEKSVTLTLQNSTKIGFLSTFDFTVPDAVAQAAKMAGVEMSAHCNATVKARYIKVD